MVDERVAAHQRLGPVGIGADDRHLGRRLPQRQQTVVAEQHHRLLGQPARQRPVGRGVQVDRLRRPLLQTGDEGPVQQAERLLLCERAEHGPVDERLGDLPGADQRGERLEVRITGGKLHVDAGLQGQRRGLPAVGGDGVHHREERHPEVVGDHDAVEAPRLAQQRGEVLDRGVLRHPVDVVVGRHHRPRATVQHRHLEGRQIDVGDLARTCGDGRVVATRARARVADEVLQRGVHAGGLQPPDVRRGDRPDEIGILADGLLAAAPARVADHVEHRGEPLVHAERTHVGADHRGHLLDGLGVEGGAPRQRRREGRGLPGRQPGETLLVDQGRDPQPGLRDQASLLGPQPRGALGGIDRPGAVHPGVVAQAVGGDLREAAVLAALDVATHLVGHRRDDVAAAVEPVAHDLGELLRQGHPRVQVTHALGDLRPGRQRCVSHRFSHRRCPF